ncbi:uncharacterized protein EMH_0036740 [Eimeria mitis]|uniref:Uncharacterized protein n=1 Tax=Eimeria mitis TaxID=44415 RepID=U6JRA0_9EIME|nr:uncharacterized protein EMH_0036740 [Eimeria mitis]CDJ27995.1 hypothetical protein, conserved [Eimeria mitis]
MRGVQQFRPHQLIFGGSVFLLESSVAFENEEPEEEEADKDVPIKPHAFGGEAPASSEGEESASEQEEPAESKEEKPQRGGAAAAAAPAAAPATAAAPAAAAAESASEAASTASESASESREEGPHAVGGGRGGAPTPAAGGAPLKGAPKGPLKETEEEEEQVFAVPVIEKHKGAPKPSRELDRDAINKRLAELGAPFTVGKEHFSVSFNK